MSKLSDKAMIDVFGRPGGENMLSTVMLPYPMRIAWEPSKTITKFSAHNKCVKNFENVFKDILSHYGIEKIKKLGIDLWGGTYNDRPKRGYEKQYANAVKAKSSLEQMAKYISRHAWGTAIDLDPERNALKETKKTARFARPEYKPMIDIFYKNGFISYGIESDYDWMHFEVIKPMN